MKKINDQLKAIVKSLSNLSRQVEKISEQADKMSSLKKTGDNKRTTRNTAAKKKTAKTIAVKNTAVKKSSARPTVLDSVLAVIKRSKKGVNMDTLRKKTNLGTRQLSNSLYKLSKKGVIEAKARGFYTVK